MWLPPQVLNELRSHALESVPEECCGLVIGADGDRYRRVYRCRNVMDRMHQDDPARFPRTNRDAFYIDPHELLAAADDAESAGERVTGVYHSHVGAPAYFSEMDQGYATQTGFPFPEADHIVVSVLGRRIGELAMFRRDGEAGALVGCAVASEMP